MANKAEIAKCVLSRVEGLTGKQAAEVVEAVFDCIGDNLSDPGDRVQIPGFGSFTVSRRAARTGRNPQTGESIDIAASNNVRFKAGKALKDSVN